MNTIEKDPAVTKKELSYILGGTGLTGAGLAAGKASRDIQDIGMHLTDWERGTGLLGDTEVPSLASYNKALKKYVKGGRETLRSKILGMPVPLWAIKGKVSAGANAAILRDKLTLKAMRLTRSNIPQEIWDAAYNTKHITDEKNSLLHHYNMFYKSNQKATKKYMFNKHIWDAFGEDIPEHYKFLSDMDVPLSARLSKLNKMSPETYKKVVDKLRHAFLQIGGSAKDSLRGWSSVYSQTINPTINKIFPKLKKAGLGAVIAGGAMTILGLAALLRRKQGEKSVLKKASEGIADNTIIPAAGLVGGTGLAAHGVGTIRRPLNVGLSWGEQAQWGAGHKTPGKVLENMLEGLTANDKRVKLIKDIRGKAGLVPANLSNTPFDLYFSTGMGAAVDSGAIENPFRRLIGGHQVSNVSRKIAPGGYVGYLTDAGEMAETTPYKEQKVIRNHKKPLIKDKMITWGDTGDTAKDMKQLMTSDKGPSLLDIGVTKKISTISKVDALNKIILNNPDVAISPKNSMLFKNIGNKRIVTIVGSGRGDQVAYRALKLRTALKKIGRLDDVQIVAVMAGGTSPLGGLVHKLPDIIGFDRLPRDAYIATQRISDTIIGSSGTSSLFESLGLPSKLILHPAQNALRDLEFKLISKPGTIPNMLWKDFPGDSKKALERMTHVDLDWWNKGNKILASKYKGVSMAQTPEEWIKVIFDDKVSEKDLVIRSRQLLRNMSKGAGKLRKTHLPRLIRNAKRMKTLRGAGLLGLASLPIGYSVHKLIDILRDKKEKRNEQDSLLP